MTLFAHPEVATRKCSDCKKYVYDKSGNIVKRRGGELQLRNGSPPPCRLCPKKSPQEAHKYELSNKNHRLYLCYKMHKATMGKFFLDEQLRDPLLAESFTIIEDIEESRERGSRMETLLSALSVSGVQRS